MEQSVSTYKKIRRLYRQSQKYAASRMEQPELTQSELQLLRCRLPWRGQPASPGRRDGRR